MNKKGFVEIFTIVAFLLGIGLGYFIFVSIPKVEISKDDKTSVEKESQKSTGPEETQLSDRIYATGNIAEIRDALRKDSWVMIIVGLRGNEYTAVGAKDSAKSESEIKRLQTLVLSSLDSQDFQLTHQYQFFPSFAGRVSVSGLEKLLRNVEVSSLMLDKLVPAVHF